MRRLAPANAKNDDDARCITIVTAVLLLAAALELLLSLKALFFFLSHCVEVFSFVGSGMLLLATLASAAPVFLIAASWLGSLLPRRLCTKGAHCGSIS
jgi:hypothetical protein